MIGKIYKDRYEIIEEIGNGGMATVYLAYCRLLKRNVAIKVLHNEVEESEEDLLNREAKAIARVSHGNIVQIYDIFEEGNKTFIVMEYVKGRTLKDVIKERQAPAEEADIITLGKKLSGALFHAHSNGVIHQDIKPDNIIIDKDNEPKITDFGIAHVTTETEGVKRDQIFASLRYASPEQLKGQDIDVRSDIFSLGMLLYEMASGTIPFPDDSPASAAYKKIKEPIGSVRNINPKISKSLDQVIQKSLCIDPDDRYDDMMEFQQALRSVPVRMDDSTEPIVAVSQRKPVYGKRVQQVKEEKTRGVSWPMIMYGAITALIISAIVLVAVISNMLEPNMVRVPNITGMQYEEAKEELNKVGLYAVISAIEFHETIEHGIVISQMEDHGRQLREGSEIHFVVSKGSGTVEVPNLVGMTNAEAQELLSPYNITLRVTEQFSEDVPEGQIIRQFPDPGERIALGSEMAITVSMGRDVEMVKVPSVVGEPFDVATRTLNAAGIIINDITREYSDEVERDRVIEQSLEVDSEVEKDTPIDLVISRGPEPVATPEVPETTEPPAPQPEPPAETSEGPRISTLTGTITPRESYSDPYTIIVNIIHPDESNEVVYESTHSHSEGSVHLSVNVPHGVDYFVIVDGTIYSSGIAQ